MDQATVVTPDGMPLVWLGRKAVDTEIERVYGPDFMVDLFEATGPEVSHYFFGGRDGAAGEMVERLTERFPDLRVAGWHEPAEAVNLDETEADVERIKTSGADLLWVGLGHPKQELWMQKHVPTHLPCVALGVGAAFDFHAGRKREAPAWMKRTGLQWLHRLVQEPRRLWRRYLVGNSRFLWLLATRRSKDRR
jgi:N-acetylglucosaminyldiphosphoundecaprenol N-acetyl-beta-D-mannosaminyltransferase